MHHVQLDIGKFALHISVRINCGRQTLRSLVQGNNQLLELGSEQVNCLSGCLGRPTTSLSGCLVVALKASDAVARLTVDVENVRYG